MNLTSPRMRWTSDEARRLYDELIETMAQHKARIEPTVRQLIENGCNKEAAKLLDAHRWDMQPLVDQAARLVSSFAVPFMVVSAETSSTATGIDIETITPGEPKG